MELAELKPLLTLLALPPAAPLLFTFVGAVTALRHKRTGLLLVGASAAALWLLSCNAVAVWLSLHCLPQYMALTSAEIAQLKSSGVQAIVVLGGGVQPTAPEYGQPQPTAQTAARLRYGTYLAKASGLPLAFAGGVGWANAGSHTRKLAPDSRASAAPTEASAALSFAAENGVRLQWADAQSRDTHENAARLHALMQPSGALKVALITHAWHLPRSRHYFEQNGFTVVPAPMGFVIPLERPVLEWLPTTHGLMSSRQVLREWLALQLLRAR